MTICSSTALSARSSPPHTAQKCSGNSKIKRADYVHAQIAVFINNHLRLQAVSDDLGIAWVAHMSVTDAIHSGQLVELLPEYAMTYDPLYLYYHSRRGHSNMFKLIVDALRVEVV